MVIVTIKWLCPSCQEETEFKMEVPSPMRDYECDCGLSIQLQGIDTEPK